MKRQIPNILSVSRVPLSISLIPLARHPIAFLGVYIVTGLTDVLDGWLARRYHWETKLGAKIDASADFVMMFSLLAVVFGVVRLKLARYVLAAMGFVVAIKAFNLVFTKIRHRQWATMHTLANKYTALPIYLIIPVCVLFQSSSRLMGIVNVLCLIMMCTVFLANLEETLLIAHMRDYDLDMKSLWHLRRQRREESAR